MMQKKFQNSRRILEKQHYSIVGKHSAVQICRWCKKSLLDEGFCYKEKFYGIKSHECCQMSPYLACPNSCLHCWRPIELDFGLKLAGIKEKDIDKPEKIIEECIKAQRKLLSGFKGNKKVNLEKWIQAQNPKQFAISLIGEPTLYPKLAELILELRKQGKTSFLVTNGLYLEKLLELKKKKALPTQIYLSLNTPNEKMYKKWHKSKLKDAWKKFNRTLEIFPKLPTRKVIRLTLVKDLNMKEEMVEGYAELIKKALPHWVEVKGFVSVGYARKRLGYERMPTFEEVREYAKKIAKATGYKIEDADKNSKVVLLRGNHSVNRFIS